ncbi:two-component regulator propeller domain-containing protein [uncultured Polaribacter sp.]|uniref:type IX secretion system anionic LPS delivery protein PorZ n=1 Tax=uncultured Polaribacter sp. TaxID=174711 RepID=UPI00263394CD|nr:two-component regulator propeller domain-containing protein [uncultured Polaribacter sp.]
MKKLLSIYILFFSLLFSAQTDYSASWEDFYSYNNVKNFIKVDNLIYALADNAVFSYDILSQEIQKISSVQGLSGETTSSIYYNSRFKRLVIGYQNGLVEVVDEDGTITISSDIINFNQSGEKSINHISEYNNQLYLSTPFGIVVYDIENLEFGDTYFIGNNSSSLRVNKTVILNDLLYAATDEGLFSANLTSAFLIDFNTWNVQFSGANFNQISLFNNELYLTEGSKLFKLNGGVLEEINSFSATILALKASNTNLTVALSNVAIVFDTQLNEVQEFTNNSDFNFTLNTAFFENNTVFLATKEFGLLNSDSSNFTDFTEIHPDGPLFNDIFSITSGTNNLWVVYGGYSASYVPLGNRKGFSNYKGEEWINTKFSQDLPILDLVDVTIDPKNEDIAFISSYAQTSNGNVFSGGGLLELENNEISNFYHSQNSDLEDRFPNSPNLITTRVSGSSFDSQGNLWMADALATKKLKKLSPTGNWSSYDISTLQLNTNGKGTNVVIVDRNNTVWIGTRRNGVYIYNENGNRKKSFIAIFNKGNLPDVNVRALAIDASNRIWIGTLSGLVMYNNASGVFDDNTPNANPIVINGDENGFGERLLGDQSVNSIAIDGAQNKWFGTDNGGVVYTNPDGKNTLATFSTKNSPLPSNKINKIAVDKSSGKVYFATNKGMVAYNSNVAPFGEVLKDVYAYPNPALKNHETITIDGRNGTHLPKGTNVKILDVAGNLVFETNVVEGQELQGGKVVWNKKNLAGTSVASGVYIVLLSNSDASETAITKIAIVN